MEPASDQAADLVRIARHLEGQVGKKIPRASRVFLGWGLFVLLILPPFDFFNNNIWGPILSLGAVVGSLVTTRYFWERARHVKVKGNGRWAFAFIPWTLWYGAWIVIAEVLHSRVSFIWTIAGIAAALPLLTVGICLARRGD